MLLLGYQLLLLLLLLLYGLLACDRTYPTPASLLAPALRSLKPRTPNDCPACRATEPPATPRPAPTPWSLRKSRRGRPKSVPTQGFACPNPDCYYYAITDAAVHALVGDGKHGQAETIQPFRCQCCHATFTSHRDTPLYRLKTPSARVGLVLAALAEGLDVAAAARVFGHAEATISSWLCRAGQHMQRLHDQRLQGLQLPHVQLDEIRTRLRLRERVLWLWVAIDPGSKLIPILHLGGRTQHDAHQVVHQLHQQLAPDCYPVFTSDGLNHYFYALTAHFGSGVEVAGERKLQWQVAAGLLYGQVQKVVRRRKLVAVKQVMRLGSFEALRSKLRGLGLSGRLNTAFVERVNLSLRRGVAALARQTWATAQTAEQLLAQAELWRGYYHFCRAHEGLRVAIGEPGEGGVRYRQRTPAQAAGLTGRRWSMGELLGLPLSNTAG